MNLYVASEYIENVQRLALGIKPLDPIIERGLIRQVRIDIEHQTPHQPTPHKAPYYQAQTRGRLPAILSRHRTGRYTLLYYPKISNEIVIRLYDYQRYYIPRRLSMSLPSLEDVIAVDATEQTDYYSDRIRQPVLFPGAAYDVCSRTTGLRGRILRDEQPMRWAVIEARLPSTGGLGEPGPLVGRTRGDDRGEFLLLIAPDAIPEGDIHSSGEVEIEVSIAGPITVSVPDSPDIPGIDRLWDLPVEKAVSIDDITTVLNGEVLPPDYQFSDPAQRNIWFQLGRILTGVEVDDFVYTLT